MSENLKNKLLELDLYKLFDVDEASPIELIKKAYRKKALELHPDKNPNNKEEAEVKFVELGKAFEILADKSARAAYDATRRQKREKAKRDSMMDEKRRKQKEDLERREAAAKEKSIFKTQEFKKSKEEEWFRNEVERLRKEGSRVLEEENKFINEQIRLEKKRTINVVKEELKQSQKEKEFIKETARIKINWTKNDKDKLEFNYELLHHLFSNYGDIEALIVGKKSSAIIEYKNVKDAVKCFNDEANLKDKYSITLKWIGDSNLDSKQNKNSQEEKLIDSPNITNSNSSNNTRQDDTSINNFKSFEEMEQAILRNLIAK